MIYGVDRDFGVSLTARAFSDRLFCKRVRHHVFWRSPTFFLLSDTSAHLICDYNRPKNLQPLHDYRSVKPDLQLHKCDDSGSSECRPPDIADDLSRLNRRMLKRGNNEEQLMKNRPSRE
jgi:hypothetical protein